MCWILGLVGAIVGGVAGYFAFSLLLSQNLYAMILPGALVGLGCGTLSKTYSLGLGIVAGIAGLFLGLFLEWKLLPFAADDSLGFFVKNIHHLPPISLLMIVLGGVFGFVFGKGRSTSNSDSG